MYFISPSMQAKTMPISALFKVQGNDGERSLFFTSTKVLPFSTNPSQDLVGTIALEVSGTLYQKLVGKGRDLGMGD